MWPRLGVRGVAAALLLVALAAGCTGPRAQARVTSRPASSGAPPSPSASPALEAIATFIPEAEKFVEDHRGLKFSSPVKISSLPDQAFADRIVELQKDDPAQIQTDTKEFRALGLIGAEVDLRKAEAGLLGAGVIGFYDPKSKELVVRGETSSPATRHVLVHELTHALQDQHFSLDRKFSDTDETGLAFKALVEGDAVRIEREYIASLSPAEQAQLIRDLASQGGTIPADTPRVLLELTAFPYQAGLNFVLALVQAKGQAGLDAAFSAPPVTTAQILQPQRYLAGDGPHPVDYPAADGRTFDRGVLGELGVQLLLEPLVTAGGLSGGDFRRAVGGWSGDRYVAWDEASRACIRTNLVMDSATDATALVGALQKLAAANPAMTVQAGTPVVFTACG